VYEHKQKSIKGFTAKYNITRLAYYEVADDINDAITREKQIKGWLRTKKVDLINSMNPEWQDLSELWFTDSSPSAQNDKQCQPKAAQNDKNTL
jgi:putative endonuclease